MNRTILHIDMNAFFASVEQAANPHLRGKPIAVGGGLAKTTVVAACSYEAKAFGVKNAMSVWDARKLCPQLIVVVGDMAKYIHISRELIKIFQDYTDLVEVFSIDECFLDVTGTEERFGGPIKIAKEIKGRIRQRFGLTCSVGIGPNKLLAKLAGELKKPDGLIVIDHDDVPALFDQLPVKELCGIGDRLEEHLGAMGIKTCGELRRFPGWMLVRRFGEVLGEQLHNMGLGKDESPVHPIYHEAEAKSMGRSYTLPKNISDPAVVKSYLLHLSEEVGRRLRRHGYKGRIVHAHVAFGDHGWFSKQKNTKEEIDDGWEIYSHAESMLDEAEVFARPIRHVGVILSSLTKGMDQISIFERDKSRKRVLKAVDEINDKFGEFTIMRTSLMGTELHEKVGMVAPQMYKSVNPSLK